MRAIIRLINVVLMSIGLTACAQSNETQKPVIENADTGRVLVVYFSATGTTEEVAKKIAEYAGGSLVRIMPEQAYTRADLDWNNSQSRSSLEMNDSSARPSIMPTEINVDDCDVVFIGYPIWWDLAPRVINTFIESHDLSGKKIVPFATSGGSGINNSVNKLRATYPSLHWESGRLLNNYDPVLLHRWIDDVIK